MSDDGNGVFLSIKCPSRDCKTPLLEDEIEAILTSGSKYFFEYKQKKADYFAQTYGIKCTGCDKWIFPSDLGTKNKVMCPYEKREEKNDEQTGEKFYVSVPCAKENERYTRTPLTDEERRNGVKRCTCGATVLKDRTPDKLQVYESSTEVWKDWEDCDKKDLEGMGFLLDNLMIICRTGHKLEHLEEDTESHKGHVCSCHICEKILGTQVEMYGCKSCRHHICSDCVQEKDEILRRLCSKNIGESCSYKDHKYKMKRGNFTGCNFMTCRQCGRHWCWMCGNRIRGDRAAEQDHQADHWKSGNCVIQKSHPQFKDMKPAHWTFITNFFWHGKHPITGEQMKFDEFGKPIITFPSDKELKKHGYG